MITRRQMLATAAAGTAGLMLRPSWTYRSRWLRSLASLDLIVAESWPYSIPACIAYSKFQAEPIRNMMHKGMTELTGAGNWAEAWRVFVEPGDVVGIKVNPVGQPHVIRAPRSSIRSWMD